MITDEEKNNWNNAISGTVDTFARDAIDGLVSGKIDNVQLINNELKFYANNNLKQTVNLPTSSSGSSYTHPSTHPATMITTDATHRFVTDAQINKWNSNSGSSSGGSSSYSLSDVSGNPGGGSRITSLTPFPGAKFNYVTGQWEGALVRQRTNTESAQNGVSSASNNITSRFE